VISIDVLRKHIKKWCAVILLLAVVVLMSASIIALISASQWGVQVTPLPRLAKMQMIWFAVGIVSFIVIYMWVDFDAVVEIAPLIAVFVIGLLVWTKFMGISIYGSRRWIAVGNFTLQPSEFAKISTLLMAVYAYKYKEDSIRMTISVVFILLTLGLILIQPDLGTTILIASGVLVSVFFMGIPTVIFLGAVAFIAILLPIAWNHLKEYQKLRVKYFLNPSIDPHGHGYNIIQALTAVGAGGISGMGIYNATQAKYGFLPVATADFLFASYAQAVGFVGVVVLFIAYGVLFFCLWLYGLTTEDMARKAFIYGALWMWFFTFWINIGMNIGVMPVTGVPLPFFSYGGTQTLANFLMLGLIMQATKEKIVVDRIEKLKFGENK